MKQRNVLRRWMRQMCLFIIFSTSGIALLKYAPYIVENHIENELKLRPNSSTFETWTEPDAEVKIDVYFFNWTNPEEVSKPDINPSFREVGPYVYKQHLRRVNVTLNDNFTISYRNLKTFYFIEDESCGGQRDLITNLNSMTVFAASKAKNWGWFMRKGLNFQLSSANYHVTKSIKELIFDGYKDPLLDAGNFLPFLDGIPDWKGFAWFYGKNSSELTEGIFNIGTGLGNTSFGEIYNWNNARQGPYPGTCGHIDSANGEMFPQNIQKTPLTFFFVDFCRKITLDYHETVMYKGVEAYKFVADVHLLDNGTLIPENKCMCPRKCVKYGALDYSACKFGSPVYLSLPHFYKADPDYVDSVDGLSPDQNKHELYLLIHPRTGVVLELAARLQINVLIEPNEAITMFREMPERMFPILWFEIKTTLPDHLLRKIRIAEWAPLILDTISLILILLGVVAIIKLIFCKEQSKKKIPRITDPGEILPLKLPKS